MKKIICYGLVFLVSFFQIGCIGLTRNNESDAPNYTHLLTKSKGNSALLNNGTWDEEGGISKRYKLDLQNYKTEIIECTEGRVFDLQWNDYDEFDLNNFIARNSLNHYSNESEIGLFQNTYTPLIQDPSASLLYDSIKDNKCIYSIERESSKNDPDDIKSKDYVCIMNRDGTNKKAIPLGIEAIVRRYQRLTSTVGFIYATKAGPEKLSITALINFETEQVKLFMESGKAYDVEGVINNSVLMIESDIQAGTYRFFLVNPDGAEEPDLFHLTVKDVYENRYSLMDVQGNRFFYGFISLDNRISVCCFNFSNMELSTLLPSNKKTDNIVDELPNSLYSTPFYIINENDTLSFVLSEVEGNQIWYLINLDTEEVESIVLPKDTDTTLSSDGKYVLCANTKGRSKKNGIISFDTQTYTPFSEKLDLGYGRRAFYNPVMQEFIVHLKYDIDGNTLYKVNANGEVTKFYIEKKESLNDL